MPTVYEHGAFRAVFDPREGQGGQQQLSRITRALEKIQKTGKPPALRVTPCGGHGEQREVTAADYLSAMGERTIGEDYGVSKYATAARWHVWSCGCQTNRGQWRSETDEGTLRQACERHYRPLHGRCCLCGEVGGDIKGDVCWICRRKAKGGE